MVGPCEVKAEAGSAILQFDQLGRCVSRFNVAAEVTLSGKHARRSWVSSPFACVTTVGYCNRRPDSVQVDFSGSGDDSCWCKQGKDLHLGVTRPQDSTFSIWMPFQQA